MVSVRAIAAGVALNYLLFELSRVLLPVIWTATRDPVDPTRYASSTLLVIFTVAIIRLFAAGVVAGLLVPRNRAAHGLGVGVVAFTIGVVQVRFGGHSEILIPVGTNVLLTLGPPALGAAAVALLRRDAA